MDDLLCDESWVSSVTTPNSHNRHENRNKNSEASNNTTAEDFEQSFCIDLKKEVVYVAKSGYVKFLGSEEDLIQFRFKAIQWLVKSSRRLNLSAATIFSAANYLDRFFSATRSDEWKYWMVELSSVACLSTASKFFEVSYPSLHEIQKEGVDHSFHQSTVQQMEIILLKTLEWRLGATTSYLFFELIMSRLELSEYRIREILMTRVTNLLLHSLLDFEMLDYRPSIVAVSALKIVLEELLPATTDKHLACVTKLFNQDQKENLVKCHLIMKSRCIKSYPMMTTSASGSSSPVTVLLKDRTDVKDQDHAHFDLSLFRMSGSGITSHGSNKKRVRGEDDV